MHSFKSDEDLSFEMECASKFGWYHELFLLYETLVCLILASSLLLK